MKLTKKLLSLLLLVVCFFGLFACKGSADTLFIKGTAAVKVGEEIGLAADTNLTSTLEWSSSATEIATVDQSGKVKGVKAGTATITVKAGELSATVEVKVYECTPTTCAECTKEECAEKFPCAECPACPECPEWTKEQCEEKYPAEKPVVSGEATVVYVGEHEDLQGKIEGSIAFSQFEFEPSFTYESQDETVVTVDEEGVLTGVSAGKANVTITSGTVSADVEVEVIDVTAPKDLVVVGQKKVAVGQKVAFDFDLEDGAPALLDNKELEVVWSVDGEALGFDEDSESVVVGKSVGKATVKVEITVPEYYGLGEKISAEYEVEVYEASVNNLKLTGQFITNKELPSELALTLLPSFATLKESDEVTVTSEDSDVVTVSFADGVVTVTPVAAKGTTTITVAYGDVEKAYEFTVSEVPLAGGSEGALFNYKYANLETRSSILAALEKWLLNIGYSVPLYSGLSFTLYSDRLTTLSETYVPNMGYGAMYGSVSTGKCEGTTDDPAYRAYTSGSPTTLNMFMYQDSVESDILAMVLDGPFAIDFNKEVTGFKMFPSMAEKLAEPVYKAADGTWQLVEGYDATSEDPDDNENKLSNSYRITLRKDLAFTNYKNEKVADITADDFIYSYRQLLDPKQANTRADDVFFNTSYEVVGAKAYFESDGTDADWAKVGIEKVDNYTFVITTTGQFDSWNFHYNNSSFLNGPVYSKLYEELKAEDGASTKWGDVTGISAPYNTIDMMVFTGPYVLTYLEDGKEFRFVLNKNFQRNEAIPYGSSFEQVRWSVVKDNNAAFELWEKGELDAISIPSAKLDEYINNPKIKKAPGATVFRFNVNAYSQEELYDEFGLSEKDWEAKPLLQELDFRLALSYALNRNEITTTVDKARNPEIIYMNDAYVIMEGTSGTIYRETEAGNALVHNPQEGDLDLLYETMGYSPTKAVELYTSALANLIKKGAITQGTAEDPVELTIEIALFDGATMEALGAYLCKSYAEVLNKQDTFPNIHITFKATYHPSLDVYYEKQMVGKFDIGIGGISGSALDPLNYMDVFNDTADEASPADKNTLQLTWGIDTNAVEIEWDGKLWSYEALTAAANGASFIVNGNEGDSAGFLAVKEIGAELLAAAAQKVNGEGDLAPALAEKLDAASAALEAAPSFGESYAALDAGLDALVSGSSVEKLAFTSEYVATLIEEYGTYVIELLDGDLAYVDNLIKANGRDVLIANGYQAYLDFFDTGYAEYVAAIPVDVAEYKSGIAEYKSVEELIKYYVECQTNLYAYYLW